MSSKADAVLPTTGVRDAIDLGRLPWIRSLVRTYTEDYASVASLFAGDPSSPDAWRQTIARVQGSARNRALTVRVLENQLEARHAPAPARDAAARLAQPSSVAIVTGQQAGAFGGPLYTMLKAATAIQLARHVEATFAVPAVPVFWVDAEDHDWDEVRTATVLDREFAPTSVALPPLDGAGARPVGTLTFDSGIDTTVDALVSALAPTEFTPEVAALLHRHYRAGVRAGRAFAELMDALLGSQGLVVFEADDPAVKIAAAPLFQKELGQPGLLSGLVREAGAAMARLGHPPQLDPAHDGTCLFYLGETGRRPIKRDDDHFLVGDEMWTAAELSEAAALHPERFSPNVSLRPLVQDAIFPTVAYVAGPSELAYQAQLGSAYRALDLEAPLLYPRVSATLVDGAAVRFFERSGLPLESLQPQDELALNRLLVDRLPPEIEAAFETLRSQISTESSRIKETVAGVDATLTGAVDTTVERLGDTLTTLQNKIVQAAKKKDETIRRQFLRTRALTFPGGIAQERVLNLAFFLNRYGPGLADRLLEILPLSTGKHYLVTL